CCIQIDTTIHADFDGMVDGLDRFGYLPDLRQRAMNQLLSAEPRIYRHYEDAIHIGQDLTDHFKRRMGIEGHTGLDPQFLDLLDGAVQVWARFDVNVNHRRACLDKFGGVALRHFDHQVNVEHQRGDAIDRFHDQRAKADIGDEMPVHHIDMEQIRAALLGLAYFLAQAGKIRRKNRWSDFHRI